MATAPQPTDRPAGIGTPLSRIDGIAKVTGSAKYAAEHFAVSGHHVADIPGDENISRLGTGDGFDAGFDFAGLLEAQLGTLLQGTQDNFVQTDVNLNLA